MTATHLDALRRHTVIVADSGDIESIRAFAPQDCTTNPSLIFKAASMPAYAALVRAAIDRAEVEGGDAAGRIDRILDHLSVGFGTELTKLVPGYVSTEVDARLSFDTAAMVARARRLIGLYASRGVPAERILIKLAATWEGIRAAEILEDIGIHCNVTLVFSLVQAVAAAEAGAFLISPFVGRILDWHVKQGHGPFDAESDPGVISVRAIYDYFKQAGHPTVVMGASFRNVGEVEALAGCDRLTVSPGLLDELARTPGDLPRRLDAAASKAKPFTPIAVDEAAFRWALNEDALATEKLAEGIRSFHADTEKLRRLVAATLAAPAA